MPWIIGGCGCLTLIAIIIAIICFFVYRAKQEVQDFQRDAKAKLDQFKEDQRRALNQPGPSSSPRPTNSPSARTDATAAPKFSTTTTNTYTNVKEKLPPSLQENFVAFSFNYPSSFALQQQSNVNFVKVEKYPANGKGNATENFAVGYAWFEPPSAQGDALFALYNKLLNQLGDQFSTGFHNYREVKRVAVTVDGIESRAALFEADFNDSAKTMIYGKTIVVHPPGKRNGVTIVILGTSLSRDVKSADDLGTKGETADILRSFKFL